MHGAIFSHCCLSWGQTMVEVIKIMATSFKRSHAPIATLSAPDPAAGYHWPMPLPETPGHSQASLGQSLVGSLLLSPGSWCAQSYVCALQESVSPVPCKFWQLCSWINGDLLQQGLCHTQVCCTQSPCPCGRPLLTCIFAGDTQTRFWLSLWTIFKDTRKNHDAPRHTDCCSLILQETILPSIRVSIAEKAAE